MKLRPLLLLAAAFPLAAHAWWNDAWSERRVLVVDTSATGVETASTVSGATVPVRLHSGNFDFLAASKDGSDIRFVAADDKTPLKFHIERFDGVNELAVAWVQLPQIAVKTAGQKVFVYFGNAAAPAELTPAAASYDASTSAVFHFREGDDRPLDSSANANHAIAPLAVEKAGLLGSSARLEGATLVLAPSPSLQLTSNGSFSFAAWVRLNDSGPNATIYRQGPLALTLEGGTLSLSGAGKQAISGGNLLPNVWQHVALTVGAGQATLYLNGARVGGGEAVLPDTQSEVRIGDGLVGLIDEVQLASVARSADWIRIAASAQGAETKLLSLTTDDEAAGDGGSSSYLGILVGNLTVDAWIVIAILMVMFAVAVAVMIGKARLVIATDKDNRSFLQRFRHASEDILDLEKGAAHPNSSLYRLYQAGTREIQRRTNAAGEVNLSAASINAIKAAVDADLVRETHKLNAQMVLLTIAISGGPFLGLLGTVVGVMITFAAIAAAGDVNVNAIAPGIAAALLATVAGLSVAIPALFGYNYLASRIKNISADMQIFVDEFITRVAESYSR
ncbi:DUF2341 domain-containing protein [Rhodocyclus tenuis]|uniref:Biopolymer transport protein ExbB n=1 Tax=Rhodocyclus tenuis TaxID=1066 RepID=A0A840GBS2_RHOTE|nr:DUF2341 domain-containing protein [Rhodocyclus tenuis]MBB4248330.1 biopolymer transport protein ExbB [Rhodocyclus tenuis]